MEALVSALAAAQAAYEAELYGRARDGELAALWHAVRVARQRAEAAESGWAAAGR